MEQLKILITVNGDEVTVEKLEQEKQPEPKPEPQKEAVKLYCVKSYDGTFLSVKKGKIYETTDDGRIIFDYNKEGSAYWKDSDFVSDGNLVPLVKRPAKVGEWVLVVNSDMSHCNKYKNGDILKVVRVDGDGDAHCEIRWYSNCIYKHEYLVLDGYRGDPEEERKEAERKAEIERLTKEREEHQRKANEIGEQITKLKRR